MADAFLASAEVMRIAETPRGPRFTTRRIWALEQEALAVAARMHGSRGPRRRRPDRRRPRPRRPPEPEVRPAGDGRAAARAAVAAWRS